MLLHLTGTALHAGAAHLLLHLTGTALHAGATLHGSALHAGTTLHAGAVLALRTLGTVPLRAARPLRTLLALRTVPARARRQLGGTHLRGLLLHGGSGYGSGNGTVRSALALRAAGTLPVLRLGRLAHVLLLLVLRGRSRGGGQLGPQVLVLAEQASQFGLDLVEKGIDLVLVIAFSEADGRELLVPHVLGGQRHLFFTST
ncbi:hypothetical protein GCM10023082_48390 [Streptomyces tremellae]|uniref:Secreted protein n=1 Tax=Streptomyces tremellae TaxID=1124239 RepID=A0ABP7FU77_9ACTN